MRIGVSGASGHLGAGIVQALLRRGGHEVVAISRTPNAVAGVHDVRAGDYDRPDGLKAAYSGLDRLVIIPSADLRPGIRGRQVIAAVDAAVAAGVRQIVFLSAVGTREAAEPTMGEAYWTGEQHLIRTAPHWTIVRMSYYAETMAEEILASQGQGVLAGLGEERVGYVSRADLAEAVAGLLVTDGHAGAIYNATGPEVVTGQARAALATEVLKRPLGFAVITPDQLRGGMSQMGLPAEVVEAVVEIKTGFTDGAFDIVTTDIERLSGRPAQSLRDILVAVTAE